MLLLLRISIIVVVGIGVVDARRPTCAALLCSEADHAAAWLGGAQDEYLVLHQTLFGAEGPRGAVIGPLGDQAAVLDSTLCLERDSLPRPKCYARFCDFWRHTEFTDSRRGHSDDGCAAALRPAAAADNTTHHHHNDDDDDDSERSDHRVCHTLRRWAAIGIDKLGKAHDSDQAGDAVSTTTYACAAEQMLGMVNDRFRSPFVDSLRAGKVSFRHQTYAGTNVAFSLEGDPNVTDLTFTTRTTRSFRRWHSDNDADDTVSHTLVGTFLSVGAATLSADEQQLEATTHGTVQLLWPVAGIIEPFDNSALPPQSVCSVGQIDSNLATTFSTTLPQLGRRDFAAAAEFEACDRFPSNHPAPRHYNDLLPSGFGSMVVVVADVDPSTDGRAVAYVAHVGSVTAFEASPGDPGIGASLVARVAASDTCTDTLGAATLVEIVNVNTTTTNSTSNSTTASFGGGSVIRQPRAGVPMTLAPGESVCVGGENQGRTCSVESECGAGRTCRVKPGTGAAYCHDRFAWNEDEPCALVGEANECPYGYCYGAVDGHEGGAYPLLFVWRDSHCDSPTEAIIEDCALEEVRNWQAYPTPDSVQ